MAITTCRKKRLGTSDMELTPIGVGAWAMAAQAGLSPGDRRTMATLIAAIRAGLEAGINWIGHRGGVRIRAFEEVVARAVEGISPRPYVFTKCGRNWDEQGRIVKLLKRDAVRKECEDSLRRLQLDVIDLYQIHWPEPGEDLEEGWGPWLGSSRRASALDRRVELQRGPDEARGENRAVTSSQPPYSIVQPEAEQAILPYALEHGIGVIVYAR